MNVNNNFISHYRDAFFNPPLYQQQEDLLIDGPGHVETPFEGLSSNDSSASVSPWTQSEMDFFQDWLNQTDTETDSISSSVAVEDLRDFLSYDQPFPVPLDVPVRSSPRPVQGPIRTIKVVDKDWVHDNVYSFHSNVVEKTPRMKPRGILNHILNTNRAKYTYSPDVSNKVMTRKGVFVYRKIMAKWYSIPLNHAPFTRIFREVYPRMKPGQLNDSLDIDELQMKMQEVLEHTQAEIQGAGQSAMSEVSQAANKITETTGYLETFINKIKDLFSPIRKIFKLDGVKFAAVFAVFGLILGAIYHMFAFIKGALGFNAFMDEVNKFTGDEDEQKTASWKKLFLMAVRLLGSITGIGAFSVFTLKFLNSLTIDVEDCEEDDMYITMKGVHGMGNPRARAFEQAGKIPTIPIVPMLSLLVGSLVGKNFPSKTIFKKIMAGAIASVQVSAVGSLFKQIVNAIRMHLPIIIRDWTDALFGAPPGASLEDKEIQEWLVSSYSLLERYDRNASVISHDPAYPTMVEDVYFGGTLMIKKAELIGATRAEISQMQTVLKDLGAICRAIWALKGELPIRQCPVVVYMFGASQIGKSRVLNTLARHVLSMTKEEAQNQVYVRSPGDEFWSGYHGQRVTIMDDFAATDGAKEATLLMQMVSVNTFLPNMASLDDCATGKKGDPYLSELVLVASNVHPTTEYSTIACPTALRNRFHIPVKAYPKAAYVKDGTIDWAKVSIDSTTDNPAPHLTFVLVNPHTGQELYKDGGVVALDYPSLVCLTRAKYRVHAKDFRESAYELKEGFGFDRWITESKLSNILTKYQFAKGVATGYFKLPLTVSNMSELTIDSMAKLLINNNVAFLQADKKNFKEIISQVYSDEILLDHMSSTSGIKEFVASKVEVDPVKKDEPVPFSKILSVMGINKGDVMEPVDLGDPDEVPYHPTRLSKAKLDILKSAEDDIVANLQMNRNDPVSSTSKWVVPQRRQGYQHLDQEDTNQPRSRGKSPVKKMANSVKGFVNRMKLFESKDEDHKGFVNIKDDEAFTERLNQLMDQAEANPHPLTRDLWCKKKDPYKSTRYTKLQMENNPKIDPYFSASDGSLPETETTKESNLWKIPRQAFKSFQDFKNEQIKSFRKWWNSLSDSTKSMIKVGLAITTVFATCLVIFAGYKYGLVSKMKEAIMEYFPGEKVPEDLMDVDLKDLAAKEQSVAGLERQQMMKLISLVSKDVNEQLGTMPLDELRAVTILRLKEAGFTPDGDFNLTDFLSKSAQPISTADAYMKHLKKILDVLKPETRKLLPAEIFDLNKGSPATSLRDAVATIKKHLSVAMGSDVDEALMWTEIGPRVSTLLSSENESPEDLAIFKPTDVGIIQSEDKKAANGRKRSKAARTWAKKHQAALKRYVKSSHYKFKVRYGKSRMQGRGEADLVQIVGMKNITKDFSLSAIPIADHLCAIPFHFFSKCEMGDQISMTWRNVVYKFPFEPKSVIQYTYDDDKISELAAYRVPSYLPLFPNQINMFCPAHHFPPLMTIDEISVARLRDSFTVSEAKIVRNPLRIERSSSVHPRFRTTYTDGFIELPGNTMNDGDCGSPYIWRALRPSKIVGMHFSQIPGQADRALMVTREQIMDIYTSFATCDYEESDERMFRPIGPSIQENFESLEITPKKEQQRKTAFRRSMLDPIYPDLIDSFKPAPLHSQDPRIEWSHSPYVKNQPLLRSVVSKYDKALRAFPLSHRTFARKYQLSHYARIPITHPVRMLTWEEAINGFGDLKPLDMTTSPGMPWLAKYKTKGDLFVRDVNGMWKAKPELQQAMDEMLDQMMDGKVPEVRWKDALKDELRENSKVTQGKTRSFTFMDVAALILIRRILGAFMSFRGTIFHQSPSKVGMCVYSPHWHNAINDLIQVSEVGFDIDWSAYEATVGAEEWEDDALLAQDWYKTFSTGPFPEMFKRLIHMSYYIMAHRRTENSGSVYYLHQGNGSGGPMTAQINTSTHHRRWLMLMYELFDSKSPYLHRIEDYLGLALYADDGMISVHEDIRSVLTPTVAQRWFANFGRTLNSADKQGLTDKFVPVTDLQFLSRQTVLVPNPITGVIEFRAAPLPAILDKITHWCKVGSTVSLKENIAVRLVALCWHMSHLSYDEYNRLIQNLATQVSKHLPVQKVLFRPPRFEELQLAYDDSQIDPTSLEDIEILSGFLQADNGQEVTMSLLGAEGISEIGSSVITEKLGTHFIDSNPTSSAGPTSDNCPGGLTDPGISITGLSSRPVRIAHFPWRRTDPEHAQLYTGVVPWDMLTAHTNRTIFTRFNFVSCDVRLKFMINATQFHTGQLIAYFVPLMSAGDTARDYSDNKCAQTSLIHAFIRPSTPTPVEMLIPYRHPKEYLDMSENLLPTESLGRINISVFNTLRIGDMEGAYPGNSDVVYVSVFAEFLNIKHAVPTHRGYLQGQMSSKVVNVAVEGNNNTIPTELHGDALDNRNDISNMDNIALNASPFHVLRRGVPPFNYSKGVEYMDKMALDPSVISPTTTCHFNEASDCMDIGMLSQMQTYCESFIWSTTDLPGDMIVSGLLSPTDCIEKLQQTSISQVPLLTFLSRNFTLWTGTLIRKFQIIASRMHTGMLVFSVHYGRLTPPKTLDLAMAEYYTVFVVDEEHNEFEVAVPYQSDTGQKYLDHSAQSDKMAGIGCWALWVQNPLRAPGLAFPNIQINLFVAGGKDFEMSYTGYSACTLLQRSHARGVFQNTISIGVSSGPVVKRYPERYQSFRDLARRYVFVATVNVPRNRKDFEIIADYGYSELVKKILFPWNLLYGGVRGSIRVRVLTTDPEIMAFFVPGMVAPFNHDTFEKWINGKLVNPIPVPLSASNSSSKFLEFEVPFVSPYKFLRMSPSPAMSSNYTECDIGRVILVTRCTGGQSEAEIFVSGGDDFRFGIFMGVPEVEVSNTHDILDRPLPLGRKVPRFIQFNYEKLNVPGLKIRRTTLSLPVVSYEWTYENYFRGSPYVVKALVDMEKLSEKNKLGFYTLIGLLPAPISYQIVDDWVLEVDGMNYRLPVGGTSAPWSKPKVYARSLTLTGGPSRTAIEKHAGVKLPSVAPVQVKTQGTGELFNVVPYLYSDSQATVDAYATSSGNLPKDFHFVDSDRSIQLFLSSAVFRYGEDGLKYLQTWNINGKMWYIPEEPMDKAYPGTLCAEKQYEYR